MTDSSSSSSTSTSTPLTFLLAQSKSLHTGNLLSLRQLAPIHQSLLQCSRGGGESGVTKKDTSAIECPESLDPIIQLCCESSPEDQALCRQILSSNSTSSISNSDAERLLVIQYLAFPLSSVDAMRCVLMPYLLYNHNDNDDETISEDLKIVLLDDITVTVDDASTPQWVEIVKSLQRNSKAMAARLLVRLLANSPTESFLIEAFYDKLYHLMQTSCASPSMTAATTTNNTVPQANHNDPLIACLSRDVLPILTTTATDDDDDNKSGTPVLLTSPYRDHTMTLWKRIFSLEEQYYPDAQQRRQCYLIMTTVLCPLLPHLLDCKLPTTTTTTIQQGNDGDDHDDTSFQKPIQQQGLWKMIYSCLEQGKSILEEKDNYMALSSILRKRALYLLDKLATPSSDIWKKYVMCVEVLEMESEQHLVDQIWDTVAELLEHCDDIHQEEQQALSTSSSSSSSSFDVVTRDWMSLLFSRILSSEQLVIRKLGIYRLLKLDDNKTLQKAKQKKKKGKKKTRNIEPRSNPKEEKAMLAYMTPKFVFSVFLPSWNSLAKSVGYIMHLEDNRKVEREVMTPLFTSFLMSYLEQLGEKEDAEDFWIQLWNWDVLQHLQTKTTILVFQTLAEKLSSSSNEITVVADNDALECLLNLYQNLFGISSVLISHREDLLQSLAVMLEHCQPSKTLTKKKWTPMNILQLLAFFSEDYFALEEEDWSVENDALLTSLRRWVHGFEQDATMIGAAVAAAFVSGQLAPSDEAWDTSIGSSNLENDLGWAVPLLCTLAASQSNKTTASELLWPSISKGLAQSAGTILAKDELKARHVARAILLLENGCKLRQLSGLGNGDLVVDKNTQQLMPPPANIEKMLSSSVDFISYHIRTLLSMKAGDDEGSTLAKQTAKAFGRLISQLRTLQRSYPSSDIMSSAVLELLTSSCQRLKDGADDDNSRVMLTAIIFASISSGVDPGNKEYIPLCRMLLATNLVGDVTCTRAWEQTSRTVLMYSKWGAISCVLPMLTKSLKDKGTPDKEEAESLFHDLRDKTFDAVGATSISALPPLFNCIFEAGNYLATSSNDKEQDFAAIFPKTIDALIKVMEGTSGSSTRAHMLNEICKLAFQPKLLSDEYQRLQDDPKSPDPIRRAFRRLIKMAGVQRHHISRAVLCRATVAWLGEDQSDTSSLGLSAIPYRDDIVKLLLHKEQRVDATALSQSRDEKLSGVAEIPEFTNDLSVTRAFVLIFLAKLPDPGAGLNDEVLKELLHYVILRLLKEIAPAQASNHVLIMKGTLDYVKKIRGWQALCTLSRFVTAEIAQEVCREAFKAMPEPIHSQIRFFVEIFTIRCATMHSEIFGPAFVHAIGQTDLSLPHVSSLMIMGGNWIVGRYKIDYFKKPDSGNDLHLRQVLAAVIPWLSSTQGFSRAIAQLLVYALIPLVTDVSSGGKDVTVTDTDWFIRLIFKFLDENREMKRLRNKQTKFFERYNVEEMCTVEGVLSVAQDEGDEAAPEHMVDAMKVALKNVYDEAHAADYAPEWKQVEQILQSQEGEGGDSSDRLQEGQSEVNFQRKIIPLDALNLAMEDLRDKKLRNVAGQRKQQLIVCASLVDKIPNLGGLARTAEIFAADRLTIPDIGVTKMDNFKSISVGAGDWIDIEEVKEQNLLAWLLDYKKQGYFVFGLEQTSSSINISEMQFPDRPTILLLGKEKEGIPVEFLQAVDQCVEIPQLGIIRSLNVHVSGAIAIWEHTKQRRLPKSS